jgi:hypothetical protein
MNGWMIQKPWMVLVTLVLPKIMSLHCSNEVTVGNKEKAMFWISAWINCMRPKDITPMIFKIENRRNYTVKKPWRMMNFGYPI